ncbi:MAG: DUF1932 domain-containing protein [Actinomycetota bacterium]
MAEHDVSPHDPYGPIGFLHPGMMGVSLAATCSGDVLWASEGRSPETRQRAASTHLRDVGSTAAMVDEAATIISICPPSSAESLAAEVASLGFTGCYVDANAISPASSRSIGQRFDRYVDGSVIGPPAATAGSTRLYLCGSDAAGLASRWEGSALDVRVLDGLGSASALKMAYASWTKIGSAMLFAINALADAEGVGDALRAEWDLSQPGLVRRSEVSAERVGPKAWRFEGEMHQIAAAFADAGLPPEFADAAADVYRRMADLKGTDAPALDEVLQRLTAQL